MNWAHLMFLICAVFSLVFIRIWWVAYTLHRVKYYVDQICGYKYVDAAIWFNRIEVGKMIIRFWRPPTSFLSEPYRTDFINWRKRQ